MSEWLNQSDFAERIGVTPRQVHNLAKAGLPSKMRDGKRVYRWPEGNHWYIEYKEKNAKPKSSEDEKEAAQTRKLVAEATLKELELAQKEGSLLDANYVEDQVTRVLELLRSRILAARGRFAPQFVGIKSVGEAQLRLEKMSDELMEALRAVGEDPTLDPDEDQETEKADEPGETASAS